MPDVESVIEPTLARYIDSTKLEKLLKKIFDQDIAVFVSVPHSIRAASGLDLWLRTMSQEKNGVFSFTAPRRLTEVALPLICLVGLNRRLANSSQDELE